MLEEIKKKVPVLLQKPCIKKGGLEDLEPYKGTKPTKDGRYKELKISNKEELRDFIDVAKRLNL